MHDTLKRISIGLLCTLALCVSTMAIEIAHDGKSTATIVCVQGSSPPQLHAARELQNFLKEVTGAELPIDETGTAPSPRILVGPRSAKLADPRSAVGNLGDEGLIIRTVGKDLILAGGEPRGTLYAVYTFLEDQVGCRWWAPGASTIPRQPNLTFAKLDKRYIPPVEYREPFWETAFDGEWALRNKANGAHARLTPEVGGKHAIAGFVHTFYPLLPPAKYFADHPEWYSEIDGQRKHEGGQLCLTNEEMRHEFVKNLKALLRKNPHATQASVSQNDWNGNCTCAKCKAVDQEEGSPAGSILRFVNAVAALCEDAAFDVAALRNRFGVVTGPLYCTKIASRLVRTYTDRHGLKDLVRELLNVDLSKQQQSSDWGSDKLSDAQLDYAASDVLYLHDLKRHLDRMLKRENRAELAQSCFDFLKTRCELDLLGWEETDIFAHS